MRGLDCLPFRFRNHRYIVALREHFDQPGRIATLKAVDAHKRRPSYRRSNASCMQHPWDTYILSEFELPCCDLGDLRALRAYLTDDVESRRVLDRSFIRKLNVELFVTNQLGIGRRTRGTR